MCEFKVMIDKDIVFEDAVYAKVEGNVIYVRDILGAHKKFSNYKISEVDVHHTRLVLSPSRTPLPLFDG